MVVQVGYAQAEEALDIPPQTLRKFGANLMAFRSERIQPGVNAEEKAPPAYQSRQSMDVSEAFTVMAGRAAYNAFAHWTGVGRERAKDLLLLERIDVLTPGGKECRCFLISSCSSDSARGVGASTESLCHM